MKNYPGIRTELQKGNFRNVKEQSWQTDEVRSSFYGYIFKSECEHGV